MKLSILLVTYNQEHYIRDAIQSIISQKLDFDYEIIIADDYSSDLTLSIIKESLGDSNIHAKIIETKQRNGIAANYKRAFEICTGEYIAILEGDDYWCDPKRIIKHLEYLDNNTELVLTMNRFIIYNEDTKKYALPNLESQQIRYITGSDMARGNKLGNLSACVFRKKAFDSVSPSIFQYSFADWILGLSLCDSGIIAILPEYMSVYRMHQQGEWSKLSHEDQSRQIIESAMIYNKLLNYKYSEEFTDLLTTISIEPTATKAAKRQYLSKLKKKILHFFKS